MGKYETKKQKNPHEERKTKVFHGDRSCTPHVNFLAGGTTKVSVGLATKANLKLPGFYHIIKQGDRGLTPVSC